VRKFPRRLLLAICFLCGCAAEQSNFREVAEPNDAVSAPVFKEGDSWRFRVSEESEEPLTRTDAIHGDYELFYSGGKFALSKLADGRKSEVYVYPDQNLVDVEFTAAEFLSMLNHQRVWEFIQFPLYVGKQWKTGYRALGKDDMTLLFSISAQTRVTGIEQVATPAGNLAAFKIERESYLSATLGRGVPHQVNMWHHYIYYYSPETRTIVKYNSLREGDRRPINKRSIELIGWRRAE
jgi:hypothetical protein